MFKAHTTNLSLRPVHSTCCWTTHPALKGKIGNITEYAGKQKWNLLPGQSLVPIKKPGVIVIVTVIVTEARVL